MHRVCAIAPGLHVCAFVCNAVLLGGPLALTMHVVIGVHTTFAHEKKEDSINILLRVTNRSIAPHAHCTPHKTVHGPVAALSPRPHTALSFWDTQWCTWWHRDLPRRDGWWRRTPPTRPAWEARAAKINGVECPESTTSNTQWEWLPSLSEVPDTPVKKLSCADCKTHTRPFSLFV